MNDSSASFNLFIYEMNQAEPSGPVEVREAGIKALDRHKDDWKYLAAAMDYTFRKAVDAWYVGHYDLGEAYEFLFRKVIDEYAPQNLSDKEYRLFRHYQDENPVRAACSDILADIGITDHSGDDLRTENE